MDDNDSNEPKHTIIKSTDSIPAANKGTRAGLV